MQDYSKLVEDLRRGVGYWYMQNSSRLVSILDDAAAAIEELQAEVPKRGEWVELADRNERKYSHTCSNCHRFHIHEGEIEFYHYCPNCGAKMEVQE